MARGRTLAEFQKEFPDEASCAAFLYARRWPDGFVGPACGKGRMFALLRRRGRAIGRRTFEQAARAIGVRRMPQGFAQTDDRSGPFCTAQLRF
jgi:Transposase zinc-ribbon domain